MVVAVGVNEELRWRAVKVGPETVGWVGPNIPVQSKDGLQAKITVRMGEEDFSLNASELGVIWMMVDSIDTDITPWITCYSKHLRIRMPVDSLEMNDIGFLAFSKHSAEVWHAALSRLFSAIAFEVQSELHALETPIEVVGKCAELYAYGYPFQHCEELNWRGQVLDELFDSSDMRVLVVNNALTPMKRNPYPYTGRGPNETRSAISGFGSFVSWQTRNGSDLTRTSPENVFLICAASLEEFEQGQLPMQDETLMTSFLTDNGRADVLEATFFLCLAGDPLEEWVDGERFSGREFLDWVAEAE